MRDIFSSSDRKLSTMDIVFLIFVAACFVVAISYYSGFCFGKKELQDTHDQTQETQGQSECSVNTEYTDGEVVDYDEYLEMVKHINKNVKSINPVKKSAYKQLAIPTRSKPELADR